MTMPSAVIGEAFRLIAIDIDSRFYSHRHQAFQPAKVKTAEMYRASNGKLKKLTVYDR